MWDAPSRLSFAGSRSSLHDLSVLGDRRRLLRRRRRSSAPLCLEAGLSCQLHAVPLVDFHRHVARERVHLLGCNPAVGHGVSQQLLLFVGASHVVGAAVLPEQDEDGLSHLHSVVADALELSYYVEQLREVPGVFEQH